MRRLAPLLLVAAAQPVSAPPTSAPQSALVAALPPTTQADQIRHIFLAPVQAALAGPIASPDWDGSLDTLSRIVPDLVLVDGPMLQAGCRGGTLEKLDWSRLGRDRFLESATAECGAGAYRTAIVLAWNPTRVDGTPSWGDFWDVARRPGKRGLPRQARFNLELALLADGVAPGDVYRTLRTGDGLDRAFRKLDQLKPYIVWWDNPAEAREKLATGDVLLEAAPVETLLGEAHAAKPAYRFTWSQSLGRTAYWAIAHGAAHEVEAQAVIAAAADPVRQAAFFAATGLAPTAKFALDLIPQNRRLDAASLDANARQSLDEDAAFWAEAGKRLDQRFASWASK